MTSDLSKQDYLKRYLESNNKEKKQKKGVKTKKSVIPRIKILDQDIGIKSMNFGTKEVDEEEEETPLVAEIIDDRPEEVKIKEIYESSKWKRIGEEDVKNLDRNSLSPVRITNRHDSDSDYSPPRQNILGKRLHDSPNDHSISRETKSTRIDNSYASKHSSHAREKPTSSNLKSNRKDSDSDLSPERPRKLKTPANRRPDRRDANNSDSDLSPVRQPQRKSAVSRNTRADSDSDLSPPRSNNPSSSNTRLSFKGDNYRPDKTLSGLRAGLQNASTLREETKELRKREKTHINQLDAELSGRNADTIIRDRKTGLIRDIDEEMRLKEQKEKRLSEQQQKYAEWGKGIEQTESKKNKLSDDLYETSKPLARYCDDDDLEERLKAEIRDDDPMAQYMRKKKHKDVVSAYPVYSGPPAPPNRFRIAPGYRWDGVDRSNGFEKKYFEQKSSKKAVEEEAYLWSVQNM